VFNHTCPLHTCVCAGSRRRRVRLSGFRRKGIASLLGVSQVTLFRSGSVPNTSLSVAPTVPWRLLFQGAVDKISLSTKYCWRQNIHVDKISPPIFCRRQYFVADDILSPAIFCRQRYFVNNDILSTAIFCQQQYFVDGNILSTVIFCRRQYFVDRYFVDGDFLSTAIFCQR